MYGSNKTDFVTAPAQQLACTFLNLNLISVVVVDYCIFKILFLCIPNVVKYLLCIIYIAYKLRIEDIIRQMTTMTQQRHFDVSLNINKYSKMDHK